MQGIAIVRDILPDQENKKQDEGHKHQEQEIQACLKYVYAVS